MKKLKLAIIGCGGIGSYHLGHFLGFKDIIEKMPKNGLIFLSLGGIAYTVGIIFYALKKKKFMHSVWHFFVLAGSILHFFAVYFYVLPTR